MSPIHKLAFLVLISLSASMQPALAAHYDPKDVAEIREVVEAFRAGESPLQQFSCTGPLKALTIFEDITRKNGRRIKRVYIDGSGGNEFVTRVEGSYVSYQYDGRKEEIRYYPKQRRLEFWEGGARVPDEVFSKCTASGDEAAATGVIRTLEVKNYRCEDHIVTVSIVDKSMVRVKSEYSDGTSSEELMRVLLADGVIKYISEDSLRKETSDWGKAQGPNFRSFHVRFDPKADALYFWSQGGGRQGPANMYQTCVRER